MSEERNAVALSADKDENLENDIMKDNDSKPTLQADEFTENVEIPAEKVQVQENRQPIESAQPDQNNPVHASLKSNEEATHQTPFEQQLCAFDASTVTRFLESVAGATNQPDMKSTASDESTYTKSEERESGNEPSAKSTTSGSTDTISLERANGNDPSVKSSTSDGSTVTKSSEKASGNESSVKSTTSDESADTKSLERASGNEQSVKSAAPDGSTKSLEKASGDQPAAKSKSSEISPSEVPSSDKGLEEVTENIQLIYEGLKDLKITTEDIPVSASGKKGRKTPTTPRAKSIPALTSPPLTRSRSRDLRKFPSTPSSPKRSTSRNASEGDSDDVKVRGRQRVKKN